MCDTDTLTPCDASSKRDKDDDAYAVIEERFARQLRLYMMGYADTTQHFQDRDRDPWVI